MNDLFYSRSSLLKRFGAAAILVCAALAHAQSYGPAAWVNDPFTPNANWTLSNPNTAFPSYTNGGAAFNGNLFGNSAIGPSITLTNLGDAAIYSGEVSLIGNVNAAGNVQFRLGLYNKGASASDTGWAGYMIGNPTGNGNGGLYLRTIPNTGIYGSGTGANQPGLTGSLFAAGWGAATYDYMIAVTKIGANASLVRWKLQGRSPSTYLFSGRFTNTTASAQGGFTFDQVGLLSGGSTWNANGGLLAFSNALVTLGQFSDGSWASDASGVWSTTNNWLNGVTANGAGFFADFSQINLTADRTITLDSPRTVGRLLFGATSGSLNNWSLNSSGGSGLTLDTGVAGGQGVPAIAVNQNTTTVNASFVSSNGLSKTGAGTLLLRGTNNIVGPLNFNGGILNFLSLSNLPIFFDTIPAINFGGGTLQWAAGNTFDLSSPGIPVNFNGTAGIDVGANNVTFNSGFGNGGVGGMTKQGSGTLTLQSFALYMGSTIVSNGVLTLGAGGSLASSTNFIINSGATLNVSAVSGGLALFSQGLAGAGTVVGDVSANSGVTVSPGMSAGTLTINGNFSITGSGALNYELSDVTTAGSGVNDMIAVTGNLDISGPTTLNLSFLTGSPGVGTYTLITYNTFSGNAAFLAAPAGFTVNNNVGAKRIELIVTHIPATLVWAGDGAGNVWDVGTTANWLQAGTNQVFFAGDTVLFDNTGLNTPAINILVPVSPAAITVNATQDYSLTGAGSIATGKLTKSGTGTLIVETDNSYAGPTTISNGVLQVGGPTSGGLNGTLGTGPTTNNGSLVFSRTTDYTYANNIQGTGSITNNGAAGTITLSGNVTGSSMNMAGVGTLILSGSNGYSGQTIVASGSLNPRNGAALGTAGAGTIVQSAARLYIDANINIAGEALSLAGAGPDSAGGLRKGGNGATTWGGTITMTANSSIAVDGGSTFNLTNASGVSGSGFNLTLAGGGNGTVNGPITLAAGSLTKTDAGTWTVAATNTFTGKTIITGGTLAIPGTNSLGPISVFAADYVTLNGGSLGVTTNVTFADGLRGFTASGTAGGFNVGPGFTLVISNEITGAGVITKAGGGNVVLRGANNTFTGTLNVDTGANAASDGILRIAHPNAISGALSPIAIRNNLGGSSTLEIDGSNGAITVPQDITLNGRSPAIPAIENISGNNTLGGTLTMNGGGTRYYIQSDSGVLTLNSNVSPTTVDAQVITFLGNGDVAVNGIIQDGTNILGVVKDGTGSLTLTAVNTYTGPTTVSAGTLRGTGTIAGPVAVSSGGTLAPGTTAIGTLTINNTLSLAGNTFVKVNKTTTARDQVVGPTSIAYGGTLTVSNLNGTLASGDNFQIFPATTFTGNFSSIAPAPGGGLSWNFNPTNGILSVVVGGLPNTPTNMTFSVNGGVLTLGWPESYKGWILQTQTNAINVGLKINNWSDITGSAGTNSFTVPLNNTNPSVFFRLRHP